MSQYYEGKTIIDLDSNRLEVEEDGDLPQSFSGLFVKIERISKGHQSSKTMGVGKSKRIGQYDHPQLGYI